MMRITHGSLAFALAFLCTNHLQAVELDEFERRDYDLAASSAAYFTPPGPHHRLFLDLYNITDFYNFETNDTPGYIDGTWLADTLRPTLTVLWNERFRTQIGLVALRGYGDEEGFGSVDPWIQLLWQPVKPVSVLLGNLNTPHYYHPSLFMSLNYVRESPVETGAQVLVKTENWYDDIFFNYRLQNTPEHAEKFDIGFVHRNAWKFLRFHYQAHWIHEGGTLYPHPIATINDAAQLAGLGMQFQPHRSWIVGAKWSYLSSRRIQDSSLEDSPLALDVQGCARLYEVYTRIRRFKFSYEYWSSSSYSHEGSDPWFTLPKLNLLTGRWDILLGRDFNLFLRYTAGLAGENNQGVSQFVKSAIHLQAAWQFSIPIIEWTTPSAVPQGQPIPARWDEGV